MKRIWIVVLGCLVIFSSCHFLHNGVKGTGNVVTQARNLSNFKGVEVSSAIELYIKQDSAYSVKVEVDDNLQQYIETSESDGILYVKQKDNTSVDATGRIKVYVSAPLFRSLKATGACKLTGENTIASANGIDIDLTGASEATMDLKVPQLTLGLTGASEVMLRGETKDFSIEGSGSSKIRCFDLKTEQTKINISGACDAEVFASVKLEAEASGACNITYKGAASYSGHTSGASNINKAN